MNSLDCSDGSVPGKNQNRRSCFRISIECVKGGIEKGGGRTLPISLVEFYPAADCLLHQFVGVIAPERRVPAEQNKRDNSEQHNEREEG